jgi:hypothetical protein
MKGFDGQQSKERSAQLLLRPRRIFAARIPCLVFVYFVVNSSATAVFTTNAVISETNAASDGQAIVSSSAGVVVAIDGSHAFNSLLVTNGAVLTLSTDRTVTMTNLFQLIEPVWTNRCTLFFRARRE